MSAIMYKDKVYGAGGSGGGGGSSTLAGLSDVDVQTTTPTGGQVLTYDDENDKWVNEDASGGDEAIILTMAEYNALTPEQQADPTKTYYITDAPGGGGVIDYSTTEQNTGQKWIDGKPIYQKVINDLTVSFSSSGSVGRYASINLSNYLSNIDKLWVDFSASYYLLNNTNQRSFLYAAFSNGTTLDLFVETSRTNVPVVLVVRYTKTTDTAS